MKILTLILLALTLISTASVTSQKSNIQGILYSDETAVALSMENGKISELQQLPKSENSSKIYIATGLIDVQINGYMGVDFSGPELTVEGVRKATKALWKAGVTSYFPTRRPTWDE